MGVVLFWSGVLFVIALGAMLLYQHSALSPIALPLPDNIIHIEDWSGALQRRRAALRTPICGDETADPVIRARSGS